jgi:ribosome biogenesis GTPase / thiamine phosphate phosphatase
MSDQSLPGLVLRLLSGFYYVQTEQGLITCSLRGKLKQDRHDKDLVAVGDHVQVMLSSSGGGVIEKVEPRKNSLVRLAPSARGEYKQIILANLDLVIFVFACAQPEPHLRMLDRFLIIAERQSIPSLIIANKVDLVGEQKANQLFKMYPPLGYQVLLTSVKTGLGVMELKKLLQNKITAFSGPSGVGKTSLLNAIQPELGIKVREVSELTTKGRHSTVARELFALDGHGFLADLPGLRSLALWDIRPEELDAYFPEMKGLVAQCQFNNCSHRDEPGCAVKEGVSKGKVHPERYQSYLNMRAGIKATDW